MQKIEITYNPYKMQTIMLVDGINVCEDINEFGQFKEFIEICTPLQTWIEPIPYKNWEGIINELKSDEEGFDILEFHFNGRKMDFEDLKRACETENDNRNNKLELIFEHEVEISDEKLAQNIDVIMESLLSEKFAKLVNEQGEESSVYADYQSLEEDYARAKQKEFKIVFAGLYSSGKSTILNSLIRHNVLPTSDKTCTAKTCRIRHDGKLKNDVTLECFDREGNVVVKKEHYQNDEDCLKKFWEITPLGSKTSVPESVNLIELCINLSHLYPSKEMEKAFNLVIIDTPGCNSRKKSSWGKKNSNEESQLNNPDKRLALDAITNGDREMVVVCAAAQDSEDESIGDFLRAIHDASSEDTGDFNDRFLFVLNKCDNSQFGSGERIADRKSEFADYLMDTKRWGIEKSSLNFVPRVFMISAYNYFAIKQGVSSFSNKEIDEDVEKQNLSDAYDDFYKKVITRKNQNYFLSQMCDIPDYRKKQYEEEFNKSITQNTDKAIEIQTGMYCLEGAIQDYIARYAYPLKVKNLIETFDLLLESVKGFSETQKKILSERIENMGKDTTERKEVEQQKKDEEKRETALQELKRKVEKEKNKIGDIRLDMSRLQQVRGDIDVKIESNPNICKVRNATGNEKLSDQELTALTLNITKVFESAWDDVDKAFSEIAGEYKKNIDVICGVLNEIATELRKFNIQGYDFSSSLALKKIELRDSKTLANEVQKTKQEKSNWVTVEKRNPIKDIEYSKWRIFSRIKQALASDTVKGSEFVRWNEYSLSSLQKYITEISGDFKSLSIHAEENYKTEIKNMKKNASNMADDVVTDIKIIVCKITDYKKKINSLGNNIQALQKEIDGCSSTVDWLESLINSINEGGRINEKVI